MKKFINKLTILGLGLVFVTGCTGNFDDMNTDPNNPTESSPSLIFPKMAQYGYCTRSWEYQIGENLGPNQYAQYVACTTASFTTDRYGYNDQYVKESFWRMYYEYVANNMHYVESTLEEHPEYENMYNVMRIYAAFVAQRTTDLFGDIPYTEASQGITAPKYDSQQSIYEDLFNELDEAIAFLEENKDLGLATFGSQDLIYAGDYDKWIRLGNSLRLRMALRLAYVDEDLARTEGEKALATGNLLSSVSDNAGVINYIENDGYSLLTISTWNEFRASKTIIDAMLAGGTVNKSSVNDPRMELHFSKTQGYLAGVAGVPEYRGVPNGLPSSSMTQAEYTAQNNSCVWGYKYSTWNSQSSIANVNDGAGDVYAVLEIPKPIMTYSEVCFLKAEAALRGWAGAGDMAQNYEEGIRASFAESRQYAVDAYSYDSADDETYITANALVTGDFEETLEQIITQKWLALFPDGVEAWAEVRRTGYPTLSLPVMNESSDIPQGQFIKKLQYINDEKSLNANANDGSLNNGNGDGRNVRVWWNTNTRYQ